MPLLSHYTSRAGLEGMAQSRSFWATNFLELNDTSEFFYAWKILQRDAYEEMMKAVPDDMKRPDFDVEAAAHLAASQFRDFLRGTDGYGHIYVTSFAQGSSEDHESRGIMTLWDRYTQHEGYCLQFERADLERMIQLDSYRSNYASIGLREIKYGVNKDSSTYRQLVFQLAQQMILQILRERSDARLSPAWEKMWADSHLHRKLLEYCSIHKDPCWEDEREVRLFCCPNPRAESRVFLGLASAPKIKTTATGKRYVEVGHQWTPGIRPSRILVGTRANRDISTVLAKYDVLPTVRYANMPLAV